MAVKLPGLLGPMSRGRLEGKGALATYQTGWDKAARRGAIDIADGPDIASAIPRRGCGMCRLAGG